MESPPQTPPASGLNMGNVLKIVIPLGLIVVAAFIFFGVLDGDQWLTNAMKPPLVEVRGVVLFNGEPLSNAEIATSPLKPGLRGAIGTSNEKGEFSLLTEVNGDFLKGAYAGEHKVTALRRHDVVTFGPAPPMTPQEYVAFETTPLRINVAPGQVVELRLEGEPSEPPRGLPPGGLQQPRPTNAAPAIEPDAAAPSEETPPATRDSPDAVDAAAAKQTDTP